MTETVAAVAAKVISRAPSSAACRAVLPMWKWRTIFSSTMMASSTTMPIARERPSRVKKLIVKPSMSITMNVPKAEVGMERRTLKVEVHDPRKAQQTRPVITTERRTVHSVSAMASLVNLVPS